MWACKKRRLNQSPDQARPPTTTALCAGSGSTTAIVRVNCRGVRFETTATTLLRFGPCYLATQACIDTPEEIYLDFSPAAFSAFLDSLTLAQHDVQKALLHLARQRSAVVDLEALLRFLLLEWTLGVRLPLPPAPEADLPRSVVRKQAAGVADGVGAAYHGEAGVFHYLLNLVGRRALPLPASYGTYEGAYDQDLPVYDGCLLEEIAVEPPPGCIPVCVETNVGYHRDIENAAARTRCIAFIAMLPVQGAQFSAGQQLQLQRSRRESDVNLSKWLGAEIPYIKLWVSWGIVFDLGPRRALRCQGLVLGIYRRHDYARKNSMQDSYYDLLTVDAVCDLDHGDATKTIQRLALRLDGALTTFCRIAIPEELQQLCRMIRLSLRPLRFKVNEEEQLVEEWQGRPTQEDMDDFHDGPKYGLQVVEFFGDLFELPSEVLPDASLRKNFVIDKKSSEGMAHVRRRLRPARMPMEDDEDETLPF
eukprot:TRINITY_DN17998_c0_g1_i2.p1 TRINITY_DN17998_c0_g1~~TRINITY_DN17998_c0_g1_i2.p1  ORF type:complete len:477 (+),score=96.55 TRINITY_DN17998_c0_g1_i2:239-1669(+)